MKLSFVVPIPNQSKREKGTIGMVGKTKKKLELISNLGSHFVPKLNSVFSDIVRLNVILLFLSHFSMIWLSPGAG